MREWRREVCEREGWEKCERKREVYETNIEVGESKGGVRVGGRKV